MADWKQRAEIDADVVYFQYVQSEIESQLEEVYVWDLDKTYLDTSYHTLKDLWRTAVERAFQKRNIPGTSSLVRALQDFWQQETGGINLPIYFITASPPQIEGKIVEKLDLDGIQPFGAFFKDNLRNLTPRRFWRLNKQIGFKLQSLLQLRLRLSENVRQVFWGDDSESDAIIYNLYSDICCRRLKNSEIRKILRHYLVPPDQIDTLFRLQKQIPEYDPVDKIYINLADDTDPEYYLKFGRRTVATTSTLQIAIDLLQDGRLSSTQLVRIAQDMLSNYDYTVEEFENSIDEMVRRRVLGQTTYLEVTRLLGDYGLLSTQFSSSIEPRKVTQRKGNRVYELEGVFEPWVPQSIDYIREAR